MEEEDGYNLVDLTCCCSTLDTLQCSLAVDPTGRLRLVWIEMGGSSFTEGWLGDWVWIKMGGSKLTEGGLGGLVWMDNV